MSRGSAPAHRHPWNGARSPAGRPVHTHLPSITLGRQPSSSLRSADPTPTPLTFLLLCCFTQFRKLQAHQVLVSHQDVLLRAKERKNTQTITSDWALFLVSSGSVATQPWVGNARAAAKVDGWQSWGAPVPFPVCHSAHHWCHVPGVMVCFLKKSTGLRENELLSHREWEDKQLWGRPGPWGVHVAFLGTVLCDLSHSWLQLPALLFISPTSQLLSGPCSTSRQMKPENCCLGDSAGKARERWHVDCRYVL